ncbi:MAG TPA: lysophospholipid acyltransferase family protein [Gaiellaceae bacterium]
MPQPFYLFVGCVYAVIAVAKRHRIVGAEHLPQSGFVLGANHISNLDPFAIAWAVFPRRQLRFMAKAELFNPWLSWAMRGVGAFPVRRGEADADALRTALTLLRNGGIIAMFPEGTRRQSGRKKKFMPEPHAGTARIALNAGVPLIPVGIVGTDRLLGWKRIGVAYGPPIVVDDLTGMSRKRAAEVATERLMAAIESLVAVL